MINNNVVRDTVIPHLAGGGYLETQTLHCSQSKGSGSTGAIVRCRNRPTECVGAVDLGDVELYSIIFEIWIVGYSHRVLSQRW